MAELTKEQIEKAVKAYKKLKSKAKEVTERLTVESLAESGQTPEEVLEEVLGSIWKNPRSLPPEEPCPDLEEDDEVGEGTPTSGTDNEDPNQKAPSYGAANGKTRYLFDVGISKPPRFSASPSQAYSEPIALVGLQDALRGEGTRVNDKIRLRSGRYWTGNYFQYNNDHTGIGHDIEFHDDKIVLKGNAGSDLFAYGIHIRAGEEHSAAIDWFRYIQDTVEKSTSIFEDHAFRIDSPITKRELESSDQANDLTTMYASIRPNYNFYEPRYEEASTNINERLLPNMYAIVSKMLDEEQDPASYISPIVDDHVTVGGAIDFNQFRPRPGDAASDQYFKEFADLYTISGLAAPADKVLMLNREFTNVMVSHSNFDLLKSYNDKKRMFPMFFEVEFKTDSNTDFAQILKDTDLGCTLMKDVARGDTEIKQMDEYLLSPTQSIAETSESEPRRVIDITEWFNKVNAGKAEAPNAIVIGNQQAEAPTATLVPEEFDGVFLGLNNKDMEDAVNQFYNNLTSVIFDGKLKKIMRAKTRTYQEIMEGKLAHSESVMYGIEKSDVNGNVIQYFYLPNSNEIDIQRFIDTQVQYGKRYTYKVFVWELVFGNVYKYEEAEYPEDDRFGEVDIRVVNAPSIKLFEIPYFEYSNRIMDKPPVQPDVELVPYLGVNNKIKINLRPNTGAYNLEPIIFEPSEESLIESMLINQERDYGELEGKLEYRSDDQASLYEVYRLDFHPTSYSDFVGNKLKDVNPDVNLLQPGSATSASTIDKLVPNKKYWYTFRSIDNHDHISYPSPVYQVEIVDDDGAIYPLIEVVDFKKETLTQNAKGLKKIMQISPAFPHTLLDTDMLEELDSVIGEWNNPSRFKLGVEDDSVWGKTFKIRLTSKKTGKKIDLKVKFEHKHLKIDPN